MNQEKFPENKIIKENKEQIYEVRKELGKIAVDSGSIVLGDISSESDIEKKSLSISMGNDGTWKVFGIYRIVETPVPPEFNKGKGDGIAKNEQLLRLEFEE